jgi:hypothetical protein
MGAESEVIIHTVTVSDATVSKFGFGIPLIAAYHSYWLEDVRSFNTADELLLPPFNVPSSSVLYQEASKLKSQNPSPPLFKVGKLTGTFTQVVTVTPSAPVQGMIYSFMLNAVLITYTAPVTPTVAMVCTGLAAAVTAAAGIGVTATSDSTKVTLTATAGGVMRIASATVNLALADTTPLSATTPATDLARIRAADGDWYGLILAVPGKAAILNAAAWVETQRAIFLASSSDGDVPASGTGDVATSLNGLGYHRTSLWYHPNTADFIDGALTGAMMPKLPGPITYANKGLTGVERKNYGGSERVNLRTKKANYYVDIKGLGFTLYGWAASGRFLDVMVAVDWFDVGIEDRIILLLRNNDVVPYTDKGIETVRAQIEGQVKEGISLGLIDGDQSWFVTAPKVAEVSPTDKANRVLPNIRYEYTLSGAIHSVRVIGVVKV